LNINSFTYFAFLFQVKLIVMIKLQAIGHLGKDAIVNNVNGKNVINFTVAHTEKFKDAQGVQKDRTIWVDCAYWTDRTAIAPYLKKGTQVYVEGNPDVRTYTTQDGRNGATLSLRVQTVQLLGSKNDDGSNGGGNYQSNPQPQEQSYNTPPTNFQPAQQAQDLVEPLDDLPF
jgi:single-strand DNA-binding protein